MFIARGRPISVLAPEERNVLPREANISLLRSEVGSLGTFSINVASLRDEAGLLICYMNFRVTTLVLFN
jgi:hypothetical protein